MARKEGKEERREKEWKTITRLFIIVVGRLGVWRRPGQLHRRIESSQRQLGFGRQLDSTSQNPSFESMQCA